VDWIGKTSGPGHVRGLIEVGDVTSYASPEYSDQNKIEKYSVRLIASIALVAGRKPAAHDNKFLFKYFMIEKQKAGS
jgi:hypothetical protein